MTGAARRVVASIGAWNAGVKGIALMVASMGVLSANDAIMKWLTESFPVGQTMFMRAVASGFAVALMAAMSGGWSSLRVRSWKLQGARAFCMVCSTWAFITGLTLMPLADAYAISFVGPILLTMLAPLLLAEIVGWRRWAAVVVGFLGMLLMVHPGAGEFGGGVGWAALFPLAAALFGSFRDIVTRRMAGVHESTVATLAVTTAAVGLSGLVSLPFGGWTAPGAGDLALVLLTGFLLAGAHYLMIEAFRFGEAGLLAPFKYTTFIWGVLLGLFIWGDLPTLQIVAGAVVVAASGLYILNRELVRRGVR